MHFYSKLLIFNSQYSIFQICVICGERKLIRIIQYGEFLAERFQFSHVNQSSGTFLLSVGTCRKRMPIRAV